ncbi:adenine nucleotide alpha hydrolase [Pandoraea commovens]|uniref:Adenosine nucleotide hydrolase n=1 Tax=Pandoraea commovens TaxID=2508289 RepID=A0A5E4U3S3_9BURK|nr:adenine nucleotide alpha hydrolase [Pandoraea commovens]VVD94361.1 adenosine nucleotide hydrolase [Pandoraea commovens]
MSTPAFFSWSGGKDSCLALHHAMSCDTGGEPHYDVRRLLAMFDETGDSSRSHGLPRELMQAQADALGIALDIGLAGWREYEATFVARLQAMRAEGITHGLFGDIDLQPHRDWEEKVCAAAGMTAVLPLWQRERLTLAHEFISLGYRAVIVCVDGRHLGPEFVGREYDASLLADLPEGVDACGESGEFHTFAYDGPRFAQPVPWRIERVETIHGPKEYGGTPYHRAHIVGAGA